MGKHFLKGYLISLKCWFFSGCYLFAVLLIIWRQWQFLDFFSFGSFICFRKRNYQFLKNKTIVVSGDVVLLDLYGSYVCFWKVLCLTASINRKLTGHHYTVIIDQSNTMEQIFGSELFLNSFYLCIVVVCSYVSYRLIENPFRIWSKRVLKKIEKTNLRFEIFDCFEWWCFGISFGIIETCAVVVRILMILMLHARSGVHDGNLSD